MKVKPYPKTKPSGIEWLGDIPAHWEVKRSRFVLRVNPSSSVLRTLDECEEVSFVPMDSVGVEGGINLEQSRVIGDVSTGYTEFQNNDVVVAKITPCFENGKAALAENLLNGAAYGTTELHVLRAQESIDRRFLFLVVISDIFRKNGESEMYGAGGQKRVPPDFIKDFLIPLPPQSEQKAIAEYLDRETGRIDVLVEKKRTLIERLKEKRSALISACVTQGLPAGAGKKYPRIAQLYAEELQKSNQPRPSAFPADQLPENPPLKPSGIEWLGDIPTHWEVKRLRYLFRDVYRYPTYYDIPYVDEGVPEIRGEALVDGEIIELEDQRYISAETNARFPRTILSVGDLVMSVRGTMGKIGVVRESFKGANITANLLRLSPNEKQAKSGHISWLFRSVFFKQALDRVCPQTTIQTVTMPQLSSIELPLPPLPEQRAIAEYLDVETAIIDALVAKVETAIERLREYRSALITAAVTGKIDVRKAAGLSIEGRDRQKIEV